MNPKIRELVANWWTPGQILDWTLLKCWAATVWTGKKAVAGGKRLAARISAQMAK